jgi:hypothetical protein
MGRQSMAEEWGPWIEHDGKGCPVENGTIVAVMAECLPGQIFGPIEGVSRHGGQSWDWRNWLKRDVDGGLFGRVLRYRIRRPLALRRLIDLAADPEKGLPPRFPVEELA